MNIYQTRNSKDKMLAVLVTSWKKHKFLHGQFVTSVATTVDDIKWWNWQNELFVSSQVGNVTVEWNTLEDQTQGHQKLHNFSINIICKNVKHFTTFSCLKSQIISSSFVNDNSA